MPADHLYVFFKKNLFRSSAHFQQDCFILTIFFYFFPCLDRNVLFSLFFLTLQYCIDFAIYQYESATGIHVLFLNCVNTLFFL